MYYQGREGMVTIPLLKWERWNSEMEDLKGKIEDIEVLKKAAIEGNNLIHGLHSQSRMPWWYIYSREKLDELLSEDYIQMKEEHSIKINQVWNLERKVEKLEREIERLNSLPPKVIGLWEWLKSKFK